MRRMLVLVAAGALLLAACGGDDAEPPAADEPGAEEEAAATIEVASSDLGDIIVDADGNALYMFEPDEEANGEPTCYDECAATWPPLEATGDPVAGSGLDPALVGTVERTDGPVQVTYNGLPLYHFANDEAAGETNGQGLNEVWWVLSPDGEPLRDSQTSSDAAY